MGWGFVVILSIQSCANTKKKSIKHRFLDGLNEIQKKREKNCPFSRFLITTCNADGKFCLKKIGVKWLINNFFNNKTEK